MKREVEKSKKYRKYVARLIYLAKQEKGNFQGKKIRWFIEALIISYKNFNKYNIT